MIFELTIQVRVKDINEGIRWYQTLLNKPPDFIPHAGIAEWEIIPGCWLQVAEGTRQKQADLYALAYPISRLKEKGLSGICTSRTSKSIRGKKFL
ncbi:hypothetical protein B4135_1792 [Caldibacillus debilis]|uniref:VOC domain-containing protein n=1 Tax=Caldibacillus debilis TaxID=301148 RepID=A0A150M8W2_9BACI|nr:hypothetical protein B4135_1792 [Caldibacillus debilis]